MPLGCELEQTVIVRRVAVTRGRIALRFECVPAFNYASDDQEPVTTSDGILFRSKNAGALFVQSDAFLAVKDTGAVSDLHLEAGEHVTFVLTFSKHESCRPKCTPAASATILDDTVRYWRAWVSDCTYQGRWRETVIRSALVLKLLTYEPTGAIVAAPTFALPEQIGGVRNWDYRYTWLRDATMTLNAFLRLGYENEALQFMLWLKNIASSEEFAGELQVMYGIDGQKDLKEKELSSLTEYRCSRPVRVGNAAHLQLQLDVYGGIGSAALFEVTTGMMIEYDRWRKIQSVLAALSKSWTRPDHGLWEIRGEPRHFLHSTLMCWVAFDRAIKIAHCGHFLHHLKNGERLATQFTKPFGGTSGTITWRPSCKARGEAIWPRPSFSCPNWISSADPRWVSTLEAIRKRLVQDASVMRYDTASGVDGLPGAEGAFTPCSFWYLQALTLSGEIDHVRELFEKMLAYSNHLGLYAEELGLSGEHLGKFPQAVTHLALIQTALVLNNALEGKRAVRSKAI